jgi:hypothetical protein
MRFFLAYFIALTALGQDMVSCEAPELVESIAVEVDLTPHFKEMDNSRFVMPEDFWGKRKDDGFTMITQQPFTPEFMKVYLQYSLNEAKKRDYDYIPKCPKYDGQKEVVLAFEGYKAYNPKKAAFYQKNRFRFLESELFHFYCKRPTYKNVIESECESAKEILSESGAMGINDKAWLLDFVLGPFMNQNRYRDIDWVYYRQDRSDAAFKCAQSLAKHGVKVKLLGYSYGGHGAIDTAHKLNEYGIEVQSLYTIDPVKRKNLKSLTGLSTPFEVPENVQNAYNIYQTNDEGTLLQTIPIYGSKVEGAENKKVTKTGYSNMRYMFWKFEKEVNLLHIKESINKSTTTKNKDSKTGNKKSESMQKKTSTSKEGNNQSASKKKEKPKNFSHMKIVRTQSTQDFMIQFLED